MNTETQSLYPVDSSVLFGELVRKHQLAVETLTEHQLAEAIRQAIASGDFMRHVVTDGRQAVTYIPWREVERLRALYNELLYAVASKHEGETRHETALRYIRERENRIEGPCVDSPNDKCSHGGTPLADTTGSQIHSGGGK